MDPDMAQAGKVAVGLGLQGGEAAQWPLQRYGRFMLLGTGEPPGPGLEVEHSASTTWKVRPKFRHGCQVLTPGWGRGEGSTVASEHKRTGGEDTEGQAC